MEQIPDTASNGQKATPARRRQNHPRNSNSSAKRNYASESDMREPGVLYDYNAASPSTPLKTASNTHVARTQQTNSRSNRRNGSYNNNNNNNNDNGQNQNARPRPIPTGHDGGHAAHGSHGPLSPVPTNNNNNNNNNSNRNGRTTPPDVAPRQTAFAGPTFHASPAPSSLPIPSFLSKAMDSPKVADSGRASEEPSPPATDSEAPTPQHPFRQRSAVPREDSPLELLFRAQREENERERRASSANGLGTVPAGPFSPPIFQAQSPQAARTAPRGSQTGIRRDIFQRTSSSGGGISASELDGTPGRPIGPQFSTPYQQRIQAAQANRSNGRPVNQAPLGVSPQQVRPQTSTHSDQQTEALKNFLGIGSPSAPSPSRGNFHPVHSPPIPPPDGLYSHPIPPQVQQSPVRPQTYAPAPPPSHTAVDAEKQQDMKFLEDKLRQTLGLL